MNTEPIYRNSPICTVADCGAHIVVWKRNGVKESLLRKLAIADHVKTTHETPPTPKQERVKNYPAPLITADLWI